MRPGRCARTVERTMPRCVAQQTFDRIWDVRVGEGCEIVEPGGADVAWLHSSVREDGKGAFCMRSARLRRRRRTVPTREERQWPSA